jgi:exosortase
MAKGRQARRYALLLAPWMALSALLYASDIAALFRLAWRDERYTHLVVVPLAAAALLVIRRRRLPPGTTSWATGAALFIPALVLFLASRSTSAEGPRLSLAILSLALFWISAFGALFGPRGLRAAAFECLLLLLMAPLPESWVGAFEVFLQRTSAEATHWLFRAARMPVFRDGLQFTLPGVTIEVARECSGIRSSNALLLAALVLGRLFLRSARRQILFLAAALVIAILKNALRIGALAWLGVYVSRDYLTGDLHHRGGGLFFAIGLAVLAPLVLWLQRGEARKPGIPAPPAVTG